MRGAGELWRWLRASVAIPGVLPPVMHRGEVLVDGGAMNNLPVDVMRELGRGPVIGGAAARVARRQLAPVRRAQRR
ncbi:MAG TPA: patatin-like phospholipase family protein, partial [Steroidobacteraceae bacterium]|nr:patatin-like phospholipase family protein [Steroidobacteraceae bacterium]